MPLRASKARAKPGCGALTAGHWCALQASQAEKARRDARAGEFQYERRWRKRRRARLMAHPLCVPCERRGLVKAATDVEHVIALNAGGLGDERTTSRSVTSVIARRQRRKMAALEGSAGIGGRITRTRARLTAWQPSARGRGIDRGGG
jgi:hypothetical protein